jgi:hypothetical protein
MRWQKSPQYQDMPHDQYMQTAEGKQAQKAFADWGNWSSQPSGRINSSSPYAAPRPGQGGIPSDAIFRTNSQQPAAPQTKQSGSMDFSAYAPGKAQPTQTPSLGTAYGQQNWYSPRPTSQSFGAPQGPTFSVQQHQQSPFGNYGNTPNARPQSFTSQYFDYSGNPVSFEQQQAQRAAMVQQVRRAELPFVFGNALNQNMGPQTLDVPTLLGNANQMVDDGFYNPFLQRLQQDPMQQLGQYAPPSLYGNPTGAPSMQPFGNPYGPMSGGPRMPPTAPSMQADPYQQWLSTLPGYQPRDQWMTRQSQASPPPSQQAPVSKSPNDRPGMTYVPAEYRDGKLWSDAHYVNNDPPIPEYAPDWMTRPGQAQPIPPRSQGMPYGGSPVDIDKDGIDDRQQYGSPQEAMQAKKRADDNRSALAALSQSLGPTSPYKSLADVNLGTALVVGGEAATRTGRNLRVDERAALARERVNLLRNAGMSFDPQLERAINEYIQTISGDLHRQDVGSAYSQNGFAHSDLHINTIAPGQERHAAAREKLQAMIASRQAQQASDAYFSDWYGRPITSAPEPFDDVAHAQKTAQRVKDVMARLARERDTRRRMDKRMSQVVRPPNASQAAMLSQIATLGADSPSRAAFQEMLRESGWKGPVDGSFTGPWT